MRAGLRLAVIGVGLIGGSFARALRAAGEVGHVAGCGRQRANLIKAKSLGVIDSWSHDPAEAAREADIVLIAVPVAATSEMLSAIAPALQAHTVVTDAGSTKCDVIAAARQAAPAALSRFVPGHPIAGTEHSGVEASFDSLFRDRRVILTPVAETSPSALATVRRLWLATGAQVDEMDCTRHDRVLAATSHLPHLIAYALVDLFVEGSGEADMLNYAAGGFRDATRLASSSSRMWRDIVLANREALMPLLDDYQQRLNILRGLMAQADGDGLEAVFARAKAFRRRHLAIQPKTGRQDQ